MLLTTDIGKTDTTATAAAAPATGWVARGLSSARRISVQIANVARSTPLSAHQVFSTADQFLASREAARHDAAVADS
jgi:hypothetical protein